MLPLGNGVAATRVAFLPQRCIAAADSCAYFEHHCASGSLRNARECDLGLNTTDARDEQGLPPRPVVTVAGHAPKDACSSAMVS